MVAAQYAYSKGRTFMRRVSAAFAVLFGLFALFFTVTPKLWNSGSASQNMFANFFTQTAHADTPHTGDGCTESCAASDSACAADGTSDSACAADGADGASDGSGCAGACADGSAGACACADGGGCGSASDGVA